MKILSMNLILAALLACAFVFQGCTRGRPSKKPPVHLIPDMDSQPKYKTQGEGRFFSDGSAMRLPVLGAVSRGALPDSGTLSSGRTEDGRWTGINPLRITAITLERGRERYDIYCAPCHSRLGDGAGILVSRGYVPPPTFHSARIRGLADGQIYDAVVNGVRNMPSYGHQIPLRDRWRIVAHLRALQHSQNETIRDAPIDKRDALK